MLVKEAVIGNLYRPKRNAVWSEKRNIETDCPENVKYIKLWKGHLTKSQYLNNDHPPLIYLGSTKERWKIENISRHHWFLMGEKRIILSGSSFGLLESIDGKSI
ncbi:MAG: hypothetical protein CBC29_06035 [Methylococcaceae bacterium TMED69]|nr:MAG: hypothetical protein CBC29_06035 [Methylococcaceae bacterium TMED69]|tara:strand:+ start:467 stop:778 length:312 start_codon:yes stop_codon:yes gene_type:complete